MLRGLAGAIGRGRPGGWALLAIGIAGCVLPVIPGIPFSLAGLIILARDYAGRVRAAPCETLAGGAARRRSRARADGRSCSRRCTFAITVLGEV